MLATSATVAVDPALVGRKRPRSPVASSTASNSNNNLSLSMSAASAMDQQRLLSFAHFTAAVRDAHRPLPSAPLVLPGISHLLNQTSQPPAASRQRTHVSGEYIARVRSSPAAATAPSVTSPVAPASTTATVTAAPVATEHSSNANSDMDDNDDAEAEDKTPWPSASQYHAIFANMHASSIPVYDLGVDPRGVPLHPEFIYSEPVSCMYFLKCAQLLGKGSFGFPRKKKPTASATGSGSGTATAVVKSSKKEASKDFEWRKMSFVTGLPKKQPVVRYITATCYSRASDVAAKKKVFRMHAVMLADAAGAGETGEYVLVHIRAGGSKRVGLRASTHEVAPRAAPVSPIARAALVASPSPSPSDRSTSSSGARPASPLVTTLASYSSQTASTSPHSKKLLHADFGASQHYSQSPGSSGMGMSMSSMSLTSGFEKRALPPSPPVSTISAHAPQQQQQQQSPLPSRFEHEQAPPMARHPLLLCANALPPLDASKFRNARQVMRDMILQSCRSADEVASYVHCLQEELAALQQQTTTTTTASEH